MDATASGKAVDDLIAPYSQEVQNLIQTTRKFVFHVAPGVIETVDAKSKVIGFGFGAGYKNMICSIIPNKAGATLGIAWGAELPDPHKILQGSGKRHRHVKLKHSSDLKSPALESLFKSAIAHQQRRQHEAKERKKSR